MNIRAGIVLTAFVFAPQASAATIGPNCSPAGPINIVKEMVSPVLFWTAVLNEIEQEVKGAQDAYRFTQLEKRNDKVRANLEASEMRALGIPQLNDPQLNRELAETDRFIENLDRELLLETRRWAAKCRAYANQKLGK